MGVKHKPGQKSLKTDDGPQHTVLASSCNLAGIKGEYASYKSCVQRDLNFIIGKNNPGVGSFNIKDHLSIGISKI